MTRIEDGAPIDGCGRGAWRRRPSTEQRAAAVYDRLRHAVSHGASNGCARPCSSTHSRHDLRADADGAAARCWQQCGAWDPAADAKLNALLDAADEDAPRREGADLHQFADTVRYLAAQLAARGVSAVAGVTGEFRRPHRPRLALQPRSATTSGSHRARRRAARLDRHRRAQRRPEPAGLRHRRQLRPALGDHPADPAGRPRGPHRPEGRAGSSATRSCPPTASSGSSACASACASGCARTPRWSAPTKRSSRTTTNDQPILDLYNEKAGILDGDADTEVDLASYAYQIWKNAIDADPPGSRRSSRPAQRGLLHPAPHRDRPEPAGRAASICARRGQRRAGLGRPRRQSVTESQFTILKAAECAPDTPAIAAPPGATTTSWCARASSMIVAGGESRSAASLGRPSGARFRTYERLKRYAGRGQGHALRPPGTAQGHRGDLPVSAAAVGDRHAQPPAARAASPTRTWPNWSSPCAKTPAVPSPRGRADSTEPQIICSLGLADAREGQIQ